MSQHILALLLLGIILVGPLPLCLWIVSILKSKEERPGFAHDLLVISVCWCIIEVSIGLLLGILHCLTLGAVLLGELFVFLVGCILLIVARRQSTSPGWGNFWRFPTGLSNQEKVIIGLIGFIGFLLLLNLMTSPIRDHDSLAYHLPTMAQWYQTGSLPRLAQFKLIGSYPYGWEVLGTLFLMPFGEDFLVALPNLMAWALLGLSVYLISIKIGTERIYALTASALLLTLPVILQHVNTMHVDLAFASFFLVGLYSAICCVQTRSVFYLSLLLAVLGMVLGIKASGIAYGMVLLMALAFMILKAAYGDKNPLTFSFRPVKWVIPLCIWGGVSLLFLGGFWYLRNLVELGNPLGFVKFQIGDTVVFPGFKDSAAIYKTTLAGSFDLTDVAHWKTFLNQVKIRLSVPFLSMVAASFLLFLRPLLFKKSKKVPLIFVVVTLLAVTFALYWLTPYSGSSRAFDFKITSWLGQAMRYGFPFMGILGVTAAAGLAVSQVRKSAMAAVVLMSGFPGLAKMFLSFDITWNKIFFFTVLLLLAWGIGRVWAADKRRFSVFLGLAILVFVVTGTLITREKREFNRPRVYGGVVKYIEEHIAEDETIGYVSSNHSYLFYGRRLNRRVIYVPAGKRDRSSWLKMLRQKNISVIAVGPEWRGWKPQKETRWLADPDGPFIRVSGKNFRREPFIYRIKDHQRFAEGAYQEP
jgi:hypothetical protein